MTAPSQPSEQTSSFNPFRDNPYWGIGLALTIANFIPGILLYALVSSVIGEHHLEGDDADLAWLGMILVWAGPIVGIALILFGRPLSALIPPTNPAFALVGLTLGIAGITAGVLTLNDGQDANIGAGLLVLFSPLLIVASLAWLAVNFFLRRKN